MEKYQSLMVKLCIICVGLCVWSSHQSSLSTSPPEGMAGREGDVRVKCVVESRRGDEPSLVN